MINKIHTFMFNFKHETDWGVFYLFLSNRKTEISNCRDHILQYRKIPAAKMSRQMAFQAFWGIQERFYDINWPYYNLWWNIEHLIQLWLKVKESCQQIDMILSYNFTAVYFILICFIISFNSNSFWAFKSAHTPI